MKSPTSPSEAVAALRLIETSPLPVSALWTAFRQQAVASTPSSLTFGDGSKLVRIAEAAAVAV